MYSSAEEMAFWVNLAVWSIVYFMILNITSYHGLLKIKGGPIPIPVSVSEIQGTDTTVDTHHFY